MKIIKCIRKPIELKALEVTKAELKDLLKNGPITISEADAEWIAIECGEDEIIGYIVGDIDKTKSDLKFIDKKNFMEDIEKYEVVKEV